MRILLARHGETPWNAEGRYQGQIDIPLSPIGEAQAQALGARLASVDITRAVASPLSRAQRTAQLALGAARADMLLTEPELQEIAHGEWEGLLASEIHEKDPSRLQAWREEPNRCAWCWSAAGAAWPAPPTASASTTPCWWLPMTR